MAKLPKHFDFQAQVVHPRTRKAKGKLVVDDEQQMVTAGLIEPGCLNGELGKGHPDEVKQPTIWRGIGGRACARAINILRAPELQQHRHQLSRMAHESRKVIGRLPCG